MAYVKDVIDPIIQGQADVAVGSGFVKKEGFQTSSGRRMGITILSILIKILTGKRIHDVTSGFRAANQRFIDVYSEDYPRDYPEPEALVIAMVYCELCKKVTLKFHLIPRNYAISGFSVTRMQSSHIWRN